MYFKEANVGASENGLFVLSSARCVPVYGSADGDCHCRDSQLTPPAVMFSNHIVNGSTVPTCLIIVLIVVPSPPRDTIEGCVGFNIRW